MKKRLYKKKYIFLSHANQRIKERNVSELEVIYLLSGKKGYGRKRNKKKDTYEAISLSEVAEDWKYCIEGCDIDGNPLRIIITFTKNLMPIITVIRI